MRNTIRSLASAAVMISSATALGAELHVPAQFPTIQSAVDAAVNGDMVRVAPGTYSESVNLRGKRLVVVSTVTHGATVSAPEGQRSFAATSGEPAGTAIRGFRITRSGTVGGGIAATNAAIAIESCLIENCAFAGGGGASVSGGVVQLQDCTFSACLATASVGAYGATHALRVAGGQVLVLGCSFVNNGNGLNGIGGETIQHDVGGSLVIRECLFSSFPATPGHFGMIYNAQGDLLVEDCVFESCVRAAVFGWSGYTVRRCCIRNSNAPHAFDRRGGSYTLEDVRIESSTFTSFAFNGFASQGEFRLRNVTLCSSTWVGQTVVGPWVDLGGNFSPGTCATPGICAPDCNGDGMSDAEQVSRGELADYDSDLVPDCCESAQQQCAVGNHPVQWRVADGGNGHWYMAVLPFGTVTDWSMAQAFASARGGNLVTVTSAGEQSLVERLFAGRASCQGDRNGVFLGGRQALGNPPAAGWSWVSGEPWGYTNWAPTEPNDFAGFAEDYLMMVTEDMRWYDVVLGGAYLPCAYSAVIEWSADCNGDGIVDKGQILQGQLLDVDGNGIPDTCECAADVTGNGTVDGTDLAAVLGAWGTSGQGQFVTDLDGDGIVGGTDLAYILSGWGPCE